MKQLKQFWADSNGFVISSELMLVQSIILAGVLAGATAARDSIVREFSDIGVSLRSMNQSFSYTGLKGPTATSAGSQFVDPAFQSSGAPTGQFSASPSTGPSQFGSQGNDFAQLPRVFVDVNSPPQTAANNSP